MKYEFKILEKINQNNVSVYLPQICAYDVESLNLARNIIYNNDRNQVHKYPIYFTDNVKSTPFKDDIQYCTYSLPSLPQNDVQYVNSYTEAENICKKFQELMKSYCIIDSKIHTLKINDGE